MKNIFLIFLLMPCSLSVLSQNADKRYPLVVSFHSICCGVPDNTPLIKYATTFKKKHKIKNIRCDSIGPLGKEGEYDMAFMLTEMTGNQKAVFIKQVKIIAAKMNETGNAQVEQNISVSTAARGTVVTKKNI